MAVFPRNWATVVANLLVPVGILTFASGFFPYKPLLPGLATFEDAGDNATAPAVFDKVIFMVVDALRRYAGLCFGLPSKTAEMHRLTWPTATSSIHTNRDSPSHKGSCHSL